MIRPAIRKTHAFHLFFPAASLYAALAVPLSVFAMTTGTAWPPGLAGMGHARELLFGFALALVAGYTLGPVTRRTLAGMFLLWLSARLIQSFVPGHPLAETLNAAFVIWLAVRIVPRFLAAKKWRNRILSPLLLVLCLLPLAYAIALYTGGHTVANTLRFEAVIVLALLMAFVGGRIIAPAVAGESEKRGLALKARVQPPLEAAVILLLITAILTLPLGRLLPGLACAAAGAALMVRLLRWRLWRCKRRPDLIGLAAGYAWLSLGLIMFGLSMVFNDHVTAALHVITIGAVGGLSTGVMARLHNQHRLRRPPPTSIVIPLIILISAATLLRVMADVAPDPWFLWIAAACWSGAYTILSVHLLLRLNTRTHV